jgi:pullulanase/glycogen debranching enzyme
MKIEEGLPNPLGTTWDGSGTSLALFSANAIKVVVCVFDTFDCKETSRTEIPEYTDQIFHGFLPDVGPSTFYGFRVYGPYDPEQGHRFNPNKLLLDPHARAYAGQLKWDPRRLRIQLGIMRRPNVRRARQRAVRAKVRGSARQRADTTLVRVGRPFNHAGRRAWRR